MESQIALTSNHSQQRWHIIAFLTVSVWGITFISTKQLLKYLTASEILLYRSLLAYFVLLIFNPKFIRPAGLRSEFIYLICGLSGITLYFVFENNALRWTYTSNASLIVSTAPLLVALFSPLALPKEPFARHTILGGFVALTGVALVTANGTLVLALNPLGDVLAFLSAIVWAIFPIALKYAGDNLEKVQKMRKVFFYGIITTIAYMLISGDDIYNPAVIEGEVIANLVFLGVIASALCYVLWNQAVAHLGVGNTMVYMYFVPVVTVFTGSVLLGEKITFLMLVGATLVIGGVAINNRRDA